MSFFSRVWKGIRRVAGPVIGSAVGGPVGTILGATIGGGVMRPPAGPIPGAGMPSALPAMPTPSMAASMAVLPRLVAPTIGRGVGMAFGAGVAGVRAIARSASTYCRRHPQWCATIGGIAAVEGLIRSGQLPPIKRRRPKGISARELQSFRRVSKTLNKWCKVAPPTRPSRRSKC